MTERTLVGQILDKILGNPMARFEPNVTGGGSCLFGRQGN